MRDINKTAILNFLSVVFLQGIAFFTTPVFARLLGTEQYGKYSIFMSWMTVFSAIMGFGTGNALSVGKYDYENEYYKFRSSIILLGNAISVVIILAGGICSELLVKWTGLSLKVVMLMLITALSNYNLAVAQGALIYEKKPKDNFVLSLIYILVNVSLSFALVFWLPLKERYLGRIIGFSISQILAGTIVSLLMYFRKPTVLNKNYSTYAIKFGIPIVFHTLSYSILIQSDRIMMDRMGIGDGDIGIYSLFYSFSSILSIILSSLNNTWCPFLYDDLNKDEKEPLLKKTKHYIELFTVLTVGFVLLSFEVGYWFSGEIYVSGLGLVPILSLGIYMTFLYQFPVNFEFFHKESKIVAFGTVCAALVNICLNYFLISMWGSHGAAIATTLSYLFLFAMHYVVVNRVLQYKYYMKIRLFIPGIIAVLSTVFLVYILIDLPIIRWLLATVTGIFEIYRIIQRKSIF
nr:oligosaccharide flippase family protein [uncultured Blautia sp.]